MKKLLFVMAAFVLFFACQDDDNGPQYTIPSVSEAPDFTDVDGKVYKCIQIGDQIWMAENLARRLPMGARDGVFTYNEEVLDSLDYSDIKVSVSSDEFKAAFWQAMENAHADGRINDTDWAVIDAMSRTMSVTSILMNIRFDCSSECYSVVNGECYAEANEVALEAVKDALESGAAVEGEERFAEAERLNGHYSETYGLLYTYEAALRAVPEGWRLPSDEDWRKLESALGMTSEEIAKTDEWRGVRQAALLKEDSEENIGFNVRYGGARALTNIARDNYINLGQNAYFWTLEIVSQGDTLNMGVVRNIAIYTDQIMRMSTRFASEASSAAAMRPVLYSVRCVKDVN